MSSTNQNPAPRDISFAASSWLQTRAVLRILLLLLAVAALLWVVYRLTTVILLVVLSIFFAYLVAPLVDLVQRPIRFGSRERAVPRGLAIAIVYVALFFGIGAMIYLLAPQLAAQFPEFRQQAVEYYRTITSSSQRLNQYFMQHRMPEGVVKAVNDSVLGLIAKGGEIVSVAVERMLGLIIYLPWLVLIPILGFFLLKDADSFRRSALAMLPRGRLRWRGDEFFQDVNSTLAAYIRAQLTACVLRGDSGNLAGAAAFRFRDGVRGPAVPWCPENRSGLCDLSAHNRHRDSPASARGNSRYSRRRGVGRGGGNLSGDSRDRDPHRHLPPLVGASRQ